MRMPIATDGSKEATTASQTAIRLPNLTDRSLDLLCVAPRFPGGANAVRIRSGIRKRPCVKSLRCWSGCEHNQNRKT
jgi:hypothetical protein